MENGGRTGAESSGNSLARWLLVIVPALVLVATTFSLAERWSGPLQQAMREDPASTPVRDAPVRESTAPTAPTDDGPGQFDLRDFGLPAPEVQTKPPFSVRDVVARIAIADVKQGAQTFKICIACHNADLATGHKVGPNLWDVVGREKAGYRDFVYSQALRRTDGIWSYEHLAEYLHDPRAAVPGTSMAFFGIADPQKMANLIAYLRTLSDDPRPLP